MCRVHAHHGCCCTIFMIERSVEVELHEIIDVHVDEDVPGKEWENDGGCCQGAHIGKHNRNFNLARTHNMVYGPLHSQPGGRAMC